MTVKEKLQYFSDNGMSVSFIARKMGVEVSTLSKWLRGEKGITHKNEESYHINLGDSRIAYRICGEVRFMHLRWHFGWRCGGIFGSTAQYEGGAGMP